MMTHYEERLERDLEEIRERVEAISKRVESQVGDAVHALLESDRDLANAVILGDRRINWELREVDRLCHAFIVRHAPSAGHLRYVSSVLRLDVALERVGDYAAIIGREVVQLSGPPPATVARDIDLISHQARKTLAQALTAFQTSDAELARSAKKMGEQSQATLRKVFDDLLESGNRDERPLRDVFCLLRIISNLKRVSDQAENISEETVFAATGETKDPKVFRILFVDQRNSCKSQMAEAYAQKAFPESGVYTSAGWEPGEVVEPSLVEFMDQYGIDMREKEPKALRPVHEEPRHFNVIVSLGQGVREHIPVVPFLTVLLEWDVGPCPHEAPDGPPEERYAEMYKSIAVSVRDLMETLRGPDAR